jgi:2-amino-4-hydroxy-6-hydroxymethyldihydropteridine diphosphokinase
MIAVTKNTEAPPAATRQVTAVVVMLGSNIEPERNLPAAVAMLANLGKVIAVSSVWQTAPVGFVDQADFCNAAVLLETDIAPRELLAKLRTIELQLGRGRDPQNKNAPRTIDLDLAVIVGGPRTIEGRQFPAPDIRERVFLAVPLEEVLPDFVMPDGATIHAIAAVLRERDGERLRLMKRSDFSLRS